MNNCQLKICQVYSAWKKINVHIEPKLVSAYKCGFIYILNDFVKPITAGHDFLYYWKTRNEYALQTGIN